MINHTLEESRQITHVGAAQVPCTFFHVDWLIGEDFKHVFQVTLHLIVFFLSCNLTPIRSHGCKYYKDTYSYSNFDLNMYFEFFHLFVNYRFK